MTRPRSGPAPAAAAAAVAAGKHVYLAKPVAVDVAGCQAIAEADRCLLCFDPPCSKGCPAQTDPGGFIRKLRMRNVTGAIKTVKHNNILGGACGVLCPTTRLCEKECCSSGIGRPIRIGKLQRFLVEGLTKGALKG